MRVFESACVGLVCLVCVQLLILRGSSTYRPLPLPPVKLAVPLEPLPVSEVQWRHGPALQGTWRARSRGCGGALGLGDGRNDRFQRGRGQFLLLPLSVCVCVQIPGVQCCA